MEDEAIATANRIRLNAYCKAFGLDEQEVISLSISLLIDNLDEDETEIYGKELNKQIECT